MSIFLEVNLPIVSIFVLGYILQRIRQLDVRSVSAVTIYIFVPALVFETFYTQDLSGDFSTIVLMAFIILFSMIFINKILALIFKWDRSVESGMILSNAFMNAGNYGAPVVLFALGEEAFIYAVLFMSIQTIQMNFFGVYYASRGVSGMKHALISVMKMPATYTMLAAFLLKGLNVELAAPAMDIVSFLAAVAIPLMMVVLGMQLANIVFREFEVGKVVLSSTLRLIISPLVTWVFVLLIPMPDLMGKVMIILSAMPTAATTTMFALEFRARPDLVSSITLVTTVLSIFTISGLLWTLP